MQFLKIYIKNQYILSNIWDLTFLYKKEVQPLTTNSHFLIPISLHGDNNDQIYSILINRTDHLTLNSISLQPDGVNINSIQDW